MGDVDISTPISDYGCDDRLHDSTTIDHLASDGSPADANP
jgi:hypothetical protein